MKRVELPVDPEATPYDYIEKVEVFLASRTKTYPQEILEHLGMPRTVKLLDSARTILEEFGWHRPEERGGRFWRRPVRAKRAPQRQMQTDEELFLNVMQTGLWTRPQLEKALGLTKPQVQWSLRRLKSKGLVQSVGKVRSIMYFLSKQKKAKS